MGKSTISMAIFYVAMLVITRPGNGDTINNSHTINAG